MVSKTDANLPEGMSPDAAVSWPSRELIDSYLGGSHEMFAWRPGEIVEIDGDAAQAAARLYRDVLGQYASGVTVVTTMLNDSPVGMTCQSFTSVSLDPPLVLVCSLNGSRTGEAAKASGRFAIHMLGSHQVEHVTSFVGRDAPRFAAVSHEVDEHGTPILDEWIALLVCRLDQIVPAGDHEILIGEVERCERRTTSPLLFHDSKFHELPQLPAIRTAPPLLSDDELLDLSDPFVRVLMPGR
jgi:3-hydroxy-9,10-secoandrosta-1,3,5(10)-triene-9,17-dione monooxygenase reductase component